ncbi:MAG: alcohol dehydrogenase catalytic domain-containing protein [Deltaproteobacteria bacterium]|nr:alcohol dehydrogenase catalytic domain-containing protein [Deltaproteobacteria bacterium]
MRVAVYHPPSEIRVEDLPIPKIGDGEILLKVRACGVCGTDVLKVSRALPKKPVVLGHELVGDVVEIGRGVQKFKVGERLVVAHHVPCGTCHFCRHGNHSMCRHFKETNLDPGGFAEYLRIPAEHAGQTAFLVPADLSDDEGLFTEPLSCCVRNVRRANLLPGDFAVVVGMGSIGLMMVQLLKLIPTQVLALDLFDERLSLAKQLGADYTLRGDSPDIAEFVSAKTEGRRADIVVFTAGGGKVFQNAFSWVRDGGALNLFASLSDKPVEVSLDALYHHEITVFSSYSPSPEDLVESHRLLCEKKVKVAPLVTHHVGLEKLRESIDWILAQKAMKVIVNP